MNVLLRHALRTMWRAPQSWGFLLAVSIGLGVMTFLFSQTAEPDLLGKNAMLLRLVQVILVTGLGVAALQASDGISGERERGTLESLMLAPVPGRQIVAAKAAAALSGWFAVVLVGLPFAWVLAFDAASFSDAAWLLLGPGTLLAALVTALGLGISTLSSDNRRSITLTLLVVVALFGPSFVPRLKYLPYGDTLLRIDPMSAVDRFVDIVLVQGQPWASGQDWLVSPLLVTAGLVVFAGWASRRLALDPGVRH